MRSDGVTMKGVLVVAAVFAAASAILFTLHRYIESDSAESVDASRMRAIYGALFLYEESENGLPPPNLDSVRRELGDDELLKAVNDPFVKPGSSFPLDPAFPSSPSRSPVRISFTYLPSWVGANRVRVKDWKSELSDIHFGILASYWYGRIDSANPDGRGCDGPVLRVNMDGSVFRLAHRRTQDKLTADDLFFRR